MTSADRSGFSEFDRLLELVRSTRLVLHSVLGAGELPVGGADFLAQATLPHVEAIEAGVRGWVRADMAGVDEQRYLLLRFAESRVTPPQTPAEAQAASFEHERERVRRTELGSRLAAADAVTLVALSHARLVFAFLPRLPSSEVRFPVGSTHLRRHPDAARPGRARPADRGARARAVADRQRPARPTRSIRPSAGPTASSTPQSGSAAGRSRRWPDRRWYHRAVPAEPARSPVPWTTCRPSPIRPVRIPRRPNRSSDPRSLPPTPRPAQARPRPVRRRARRRPPPALGPARGRPTWVAPAATIRRRHRARARRARRRAARAAAAARVCVTSSARPGTPPSGSRWRTSSWPRPSSPRSSTRSRSSLRSSAWRSRWRSSRRCSSRSGRRCSSGSGSSARSAGASSSSPSCRPRSPWWRCSSPSTSRRAISGADSSSRPWSACSSPSWRRSGCSSGCGWRSGRPSRRPSTRPRRRWSWAWSSERCSGRSSGSSSGPSVRGRSFGQILGSAIGSLLLGALAGGALGAFSSITFSWEVAVAMGIATLLGVWIALCALEAARGGIDFEAWTQKFYPDPIHRECEGDDRVGERTVAARPEVVAAGAEQAHPTVLEARAEVDAARAAFAAEYTTLGKSATPSTSRPRSDAPPPSRRRWPAVPPSSPSAGPRRVVRPGQAQDRRGTTTAAEIHAAR